jgi:hypothetical protein
MAWRRFGGGRVIFLRLMMVALRFVLVALRFVLVALRFVLVALRFVLNFRHDCLPPRPPMPLLCAVPVRAAFVRRFVTVGQ